MSVSYFMRFDKLITASTASFSLGLDLFPRTDRGYERLIAKRNNLRGSEDAILVRCRLQERLELVLVRSVSVVIRNSNICE
jgi:hypothetical protein